MEAPTSTKAGTKAGTKTGRPTLPLLGKPSFAVLLTALLFWWPALTPTLIPRTWTTQAVAGAAALAVAGAIGALVGYWIRRLWSFRAGPGLQRSAWVLLGIGWASAVMVGPVLWMAWQNDQRGLMGMEALGGLEAALMAALTLLLAFAILVVGRVIANVVLAVIRISRRRMPAAPLAPLVGLAGLALGVVLAGWVGWLGFTAFAYATHGARNAETDAGAYPPRSSSASGSDVSLVPWGTLGRWGRNFVSSTTSIEELEAFHGPGAELSEPVRVYVGLDSAASVAERVNLAVRELERAGGFDREILAVWVPTGTGWMVPEAAAAFEQVYRGNTAIVGVQYSFLPSQIAVFIDRGAELETGSALFAAVHARWSRLPPEERPKLVVFGKSLGTAGVETSFAAADAMASIGRLTALTDGALIVGAQYGNPIHAQITRERDRGSPVWQPVFDGGRTVRFLNRGPDQPDLPAEWPTPRIVYLQHPSDPVALWSVDALWSPPEWMDEPRGFDVPDAVVWFPIVSAIHALADMFFQLSAPPGFGHVYSPDYVRGWAAVLPPPGWTDADSRRLEDFLDSASRGESEL